MKGKWLTDLNGDINEPFDLLVEQLYPKDSYRKHLGFDPIETYLDSKWVYLENDEVVGRFAIYNNPHLAYQKAKAVALGSYECVDDSRIARVVLSKAKELALEMKAQWLIGPMEGSTWNNYRFDLNNDQPKFFMEPEHCEYYPKQWEDEGFQIISNYVTRLDDILSFDQDKLEKFEFYFKEKGAVLRHLNMEKLEEDLFKIGAFSLQAFSDNLFYTPVSVSSFVKKYLKLKSYFDPNLVWIVEDSKGEIHALFFAIRDHWDPEKETMIIKSVARKSDSQFRGISTYLSFKTLQTARNNGFKKVLHAFMLKENTSINISNKYASKDYKEYGLYGIKL